MGATRCLRRAAAEADACALKGSVCNCNLCDAVSALCALAKAVELLTDPRFPLWRFDSMLAALLSSQLLPSSADTLISHHAPCHPGQCTLLQCTTSINCTEHSPTAS